MENIKIKNRIIGGAIALILFLSATGYQLIQEDLSQYWVGLAFTGAFSAGMVIYIMSLSKEQKRLKREKEKRKKK